LAQGEPLNQYNDEGDTEIIVAARANDLDLAKRLLEKKASPNLKVNLEEDDFGAGVTALHIAAMNENKAMCELLYKNGALLNVKDKMGFTPLDHILSNFDPQLNPVDPIFGKKVKPKMTRKGRETIAYLRAKGGKSMTLKQREAVWETNDVFLNMTKEMGEFNNQLKRIENYGLGPNDNREGFNDELNEMNQMMFQMMGFGSNELETPKIKETNTSIHDAAMRGNIEAVKQHIATGTDVNTKDNLEGTPLQHAAYSGHKEIAELLISEGGDVNAVGGYSKATPLHYAARNGHKEIAELLIGNGADVNVKDEKKGETPLGWASGYGRTEIIKLLIAKGADVNTKNNDGKTPIDLTDTTFFPGEAKPLLRKHGGKTGEELKAEGK